MYTINTLYSTGYIDFDFVRSRLDRKSTLRYVSFVGGNLVTWRSEKQNVVLVSSAEAEYCVPHHATRELTWLRILLSELGFGPKKPMILFGDDMIAIEIANNPIQHDRTKHIELDRNYIKDNLDFGMIKVPYIKSADQLDDMMTHAVISGLFYASLSRLGMCDIYAPTWGGESAVYSCSLIPYIKYKRGIHRIYNYNSC